MEVITPNGYRQLFLSDYRAQNIKESRPHYTVKAGGAVPPAFTGVFMGRVNFVNGIAHPEKYCDVKLCVMRGCEDITSSEQKKELVGRDLRKILVSRDGAFGDSLFVTSALKALKEKYPLADIDVYGRADSRIVFENLPFVNAIIHPPRLTELFAAFDDYDEVFDLVQSIEHNPVADRSNTPEIYEDIMGIEIKDKTPIYIPRPEELQNAMRMLHGLKIDFSRKIIVFQPHATAAVRRIPYKDSLMIANKVASAGFNVVLVGHEAEYASYRLFSCNKCNELGCGDTRKENECQKCKAKEITYIENHQRVVDTRAYTEPHSPRDKFAIAHYSSLVVSTDTFWGHLASAMNKPSVMIFTNYHPMTRLSHYPLCTLVSCDYEKEAPCGPCNSLCDKCPLYGDNPKCVVSISAKKIVDAIFKSLSGSTSLYNPLRDKMYSGKIENKRACPFCDADESSEFTTKSDITYFACSKCQSLYTHRAISSSEIKKHTASIIKGNRSYRPSRNIDLKNFLEAYINIRKSDDDKASEDVSTFVDLVDFDDKFVGREESSYAVMKTTKENVSAIDGRDVFFIDGLMEKEDPRAFICSLYDRMSDDSYLCLVNPVAENLMMNNRVNAWLPLNGIVAGMNQAIPSKKILHRWFNSYNGLLKDKFTSIGTAINKDAMVIVLRRTSNGNKEKLDGNEGGLLPKEITP